VISKSQNQGDASIARFHPITVLSRVEQAPSTSKAPAFP